MSMAEKEEKKGDEEMKLAHYDIAKQCFINAAEILVSLARSKPQSKDQALKSKIKNLLQKVTSDCNI